ncbi:MAG: type IV toxin-antitoxin system AbiEi family antitoxin domain-containing protein [Candidatus Hatepunaea meridiana]|nr:type IV toxin-antitoxin system AbiEi family antitoxin domain-containing protein [Candidatus Hatepunaea meridiana]
MQTPQQRFSKARTIFKRRSGLLRMREAIDSGIHRTMLYAMLEEGVIQRLSRGLYRLTDLPEMGNPDFVAVACKAPNAVICLISALSFHEITNQVPHEVQLAIARKTAPPHLDYPPTRIFIFSNSTFREGMETHRLDGVAVRIYSPAKTVADCFKYRNKIGLDVAVEALKLYCRHRDTDLNELLRCARICRVQNIITPYIESLI